MSVTLDTSQDERSPEKLIPENIADNEVTFDVSQLDKFPLEELPFKVERLNIRPISLTLEVFQFEKSILRSPSALVMPELQSNIRLISVTPPDTSSKKLVSVILGKTM